MTGFFNLITATANQCTSFYMICWLMFEGIHYVTTNPKTRKIISNFSRITLQYLRKALRGIHNISQPAFTYSKSTLKTQEQPMKSA